MFSCFKREFISRLLFKKIIFILLTLLHYINNLIPKKSNRILAFIDYEYINGKYLPSKHDNVYILVEFLLKSKKNIDIVYANSNNFGGRSSQYYTFFKKLLTIYYGLTSKVILSKQPSTIYSSYYTKKQHLICFGYFIPFKADALQIHEYWHEFNNIINSDFTIGKCQQYKELVWHSSLYPEKYAQRTNFTYITSSMYTSEVMSKAFGLSLKNFHVLGSLKSEFISTFKTNILDIYNLKSQIDTIIIYTPTFRDLFMQKSIDNFKKDDLNIFGYENEISLMEDFLVSNKILILIKLHKKYAYYRELEELFKKEDKSYFKNCYFLDFEIEAKYELSVYDLFENSDAMIADYSSISFDYLPYDKPIIYNIPDIEEYREYRGFSYEPMEDMMVGDKVKTIDKFKEAILKVKNNKDEYRDRRKEVLSLVNEIPKGKALENIYGYIEEIIN